MTKNHWINDVRSAALIRFSLSLTLLNVLGYTLLGFEPAIITPFFAVLIAVLMQILIETCQSSTTETKPAFLINEGASIYLHFLPAYISALAISMLVFSNGSLYEIVFAILVAVGSKYVFIAPVTYGNKKETFRHFFNPSNLGISVVLVLFPWVGISPPYQFTEYLSGVEDIIIILVLFSTGSLLNTKFTKRMLLIFSWFGAFALQALIRAWIHDTSWLAGLVPMTGLAFILFSFYMITDPPTTPNSKLGQIVFGISNAVLYAMFMELHIVFGMFYALTISTGCRGIYLWWQYLKPEREVYPSASESLL